MKDTAVSINSLETRKAMLNELIIKGDTMLAMELFYAEDVSMQENEDEPAIGKATCMAIERRKVKAVQGFAATLLSQAVDVLNNIVFTEWEFVYTNYAGIKMKLTEVSVQYWKGEQIIKEKFYYKNHCRAI